MIPNLFLLLFLSMASCPRHEKQVYPRFVERIPDFQAELADIDRRLIRDRVSIGD